MAGVGKILVVDLIRMEMNVVIFFGLDILDYLVCIGQDIDDLFKQIVDEQ
jgi:hypothetical protein